MTAKEKLRERVDSISEDEAAELLWTVEHLGARSESDEELGALLDEEGDELLGELDAREKAAGSSPSKA